MNTVLRLTLSLLIALAPIHARVFAAEPNPYYEPANSVAVEINDVTYSLQKLDETIRDIRETYNTASAGLTHDAAVAIDEKANVALLLLGTVLNDEHLDEGIRVNAMKRLSGALAALTFHVMRDPNADTRDVDDKPQEVENAVEKFLNFARYMARDTALVRWPEKGGLPAFGPKERALREQLAFQIIRKYQDFASRGLPKYEDDNQETRKLRDYTISNQRMVQKIKQAGLTAQKTWTGLFLAASAWGYLLPQFDVVGFVEGGRSDNSLLASGAIYGTLLAIAFVLKGLAISGDNVRATKDLIAILDGSQTEMKPLTRFQNFKEKLWKLNREKTKKGASIVPAAGKRSQAESCAVSYGDTAEANQASFSKPSWMKDQ